MKILDKYLLFIAYFFLAISGLPLLFYSEHSSYISFSLIVIAIILYLVEKRKSIKTFFTSSKVSMFDKYIECVLDALLLLLFLNQVHVISIDARLWPKIILGGSIGIAVIFIILKNKNFVKALLLKRNCISISDKDKKTIKMIKDEENNNNDGLKIKTLYGYMKYTIIGTSVLTFFSLLILHNRGKTIDVDKIFNLILIMFCVLCAIFDYKIKKLTKLE